MWRKARDTVDWMAAGYVRVGGGGYARHADIGRAKISAKQISS
jgi:hypothetical protein